MKTKKYLILSAVFFALFVIFTIIVKFVDVSAIGPNGSKVGLSILNQGYHNLIVVNFSLYKITDYSEFLLVAIGMVYAIMGVYQWVKRKSIKKVDSELIKLGAFYIILFLVYLAFEFIKINFRPVLIDGVLETSYPSSTTMLSITFLATSIFISNKYIKNKLAKNIAKYFQIAFILFLIVGRLISGVHWITDIIGSIILSTSLVLLFFGIVNFKNDQTKS